MILSKLKPSLLPLQRIGALLVLVGWMGLMPLSAQQVYQVKDISLGESSANIYGFAVMQNTGYFWVNEEGLEPQIWRTDGRALGTFQVSTLERTTLTRTPVVVGDSLLIFTSYSQSTGGELYFSDGSIGSGELLVDINPGMASSNRWFGVGDGKYAYFLAKEPGWEGVYRTDGTVEGTIQLLENCNGIDEMLAFRGSNFLRAYRDGATWLLKTDGTVDGTEYISEITYESVSIAGTGLAVLNDSLYFLKNKEGEGVSLWKTDGSVAGLEKIIDLNPPGFGDGHSLTRVGDQLFFSANDGINGSEIWRSDGTTEGTTIMTNFNDSTSSFSSGSSFTPFRDGMLFARREEATGTELWFSDGTADGTHLVKDIFPGPDSGLPFLSHSLPFDSLLFFSARSEKGRELWRTDGTEEGTLMVKDICAGDCDGISSSYVPLDEDRFIFSGLSLEWGQELWIYDRRAITHVDDVLPEEEVYLHIYPNPTSENEVGLNWSKELNPSMVQVFNLNGEKVKEKNIDNFEASSLLSTENWSSGYYLVCLLDDLGRILVREKLIVL